MTPEDAHIGKNPMTAAISQIAAEGIPTLKHVDAESVHDASAPHTEVRPSLATFALLLPFVLGALVLSFSPRSPLLFMPLPSSPVLLIGSFG